MRDQILELNKRVLELDDALKALKTARRGLLDQMGALLPFKPGDIVAYRDAQELVWVGLVIGPCPNGVEVHQFSKTGLPRRNDEYRKIFADTWAVNEPGPGKLEYVRVGQVDQNNCPHPEGRARDTKWVDHSPGETVCLCCGAKLRDEDFNWVASAPEDNSVRDFVKSLYGRK